MGPVVIHQDNKSAIVLENTGRSNAGRTRHINVKYYFVKDRVESKDVRIVYTPTHEMVADFFTKPLQGSLFLKFRSVIMGHDSPTDSSLVVGLSEECIMHFLFFTPTWWFFGFSPWESDISSEMSI